MSGCFEKQPPAHQPERPLCARCGKKPAMKSYDVCFECFSHKVKQ
jgi:hypothetical protein